MSNKRTKRTAKKTSRAPKDPHVEPTEERVAKASGGTKAYVVAGLKVVLGAAMIVGLSAAFAFALHRYARQTPRFAITEIAVEGTRRLLRQEVLGAAGIDVGENIFVLDVDEAEKRLIESPWIKHARVTRRLPGSVKVQILEREPVALALLGDQIFLVSQEGEPFKPMGVGDPHDLPLVTGLSLRELRRDRRAEIRRLKDALVLLRDYETLALGRALPPEEVHLTNDGMAVLTVGKQGLALHLGAPPFKSKLLRAAKIVERTKDKGGKPGVVFLDNQAHPERVVVRLR